MLARLAIGAVFLSSLLAQPPAEQAPAAVPETPLFRGQVTEVIVPVTVTDDKGRFITNLDASDFRIWDQGKEQKVAYFSRERSQPMVVGFLLDMSNATRLYWKSFQDAATELVFTLVPDDKRFSGYLVAYGTEAELAVNTTQDPQPIVERIRKLKPGGGAALYDAIYLALTRRNLIKGEPIEPRRVLIIIGDGHDSASSKTLEEVLELAQRNLVTIYAMSTTAFGFTSEGTANLKRLCEETGGRVEFPLQNPYSDVSGYVSTPNEAGNYSLGVGTGEYAAEIAKGIFSSVAALAGEVTTQYILRYTPNVTGPERAFRQIRVEVKLPGVVVRHRTGYYPENP
jgi:VWFA-related protein